MWFRVKTLGWVNNCILQWKMGEEVGAEVTKKTIIQYSIFQNVVSLYLNFANY
jgi:hypothetical protein